MTTSHDPRLLAGIVDFAGLFPPAGLTMADAVAEYAAARSGAEAWMLGRFVLPAARLAEFTATAPDAAHTAPWHLSAIVGDGSEPDAAAVAALNAAGGAIVDSVECKPASPDGLDWLARTFAGLEVYVEVPAGPAAPAWLEQVAAHGLRGKVRTGGLAAGAFPAADDLAAFLEAAVRLGVPFKATAGLHHAVRGDYRLTYEPGSADAAMYGYLNVLLATTALAAGHGVATARDLLLRQDAAALVIEAGGMRWGAVALDATAIARARTRHLLSFGSCSFREPSEEYRALAGAPATATR
ncbi:MAG: hypothetical protein AB7O67_11390 [Vicinamibacterales bacterium]